MLPFAFSMAAWKLEAWVGSAVVVLIMAVVLGLVLRTKRRRSAIDTAILQTLQRGPTRLRDLTMTIDASVPNGVPYGEVVSRVYVLLGRDVITRTPFPGAHGKIEYDFELTAAGQEWLRFHAHHRVRQRA